MTMTTKTLADFFEVYRPKSPDEQKFVDKHVVIKHKDRNGNGDDVFNAKNIKKADRKKERHGYEPGEDEKVYEEVKGLDEASDALMSLKNRIASNQKKMRAIPGIHPDKKRLAIQIEKDKKRHNELFNRMMGKNESIDEKTLTPAEMTKREAVVKAIKRGNPKMDKSMAYAIATKTAKRVAEEADLDEALEPWMGKNIDKPAYLRKKEYEDNKKDANPPKALKRIKEDQYEDFEQIDEISKGKAQKYIDKARTSADDLRWKSYGDYMGPDGDWEATPGSIKAGAKAAQREKMIALARAKRNKTGETAPHYTPRAKAKVKATNEGAEPVDEMRGRSYATVKPGYYHKGPVNNKPLDGDLRKGLDAIDAAFKKAKIDTKSPSYKPKTPVAEDVESIDELSKGLLQRYLRKGQKDFFDKGDDAFDQELKKRGVHWVKTVHSPNSYSRTVNDKDAFAKAVEASKTNPTQIKADKRQASLSLAASKIRKINADDKAALKAMDQRRKTGMSEDVVQIDEIGGTKAGRAGLGAYINKRAADIGARAYEAGKSISWDADEDAYKKELRHRAGIEQAVGKLTKPRKFRRYYGEELASSFVDRYMPEQADMPALTNEEKLVTALLDLNISETIASDVLALHNTLDEQNQRLLIDNIMEGQIDDVVDFAIQNRN
jgi:hypothetical protein